MTEIEIMYLLIALLGVIQLIFIIRNALYHIRNKNTLKEFIIEYKKTERQTETNRRNIDTLTDVAKGEKTLI